jgi:voltage-gated potassium channel
MKKRTIYDICIMLLALLAVVITIIDINSGLTFTLSAIDTGILIIFILDYVIRLVLSTDKKSFIKANIVDLISIIPFNSLFRAARLLKLTKLLKFIKIFRFIAVFIRLIKKTDLFITTNLSLFLQFIEIVVSLCKHMLIS